jgi:hypothetical protein
LAEVAEGVDVDTAVTREEAGTLAVQGDAAYSPECVGGLFRQLRLYGVLGGPSFLFALCWDTSLAPANPWSGGPHRTGAEGQPPIK